MSVSCANVEKLALAATVITMADASGCSVQSTMRVRSLALEPMPRCLPRGLMRESSSRILITNTIEDHHENRICRAWNHGFANGC